MVSGIINCTNEFNRRCHEVFIDDENETVYYSIEMDEDGTIKILMDETLGDEHYIYTHYYIPDMDDRPQALEYLFGFRNSFKD